MNDALDRSRLRAYTSARVGLRRAGTSLATSELLDLAQCLAEARDAVHAELSVVSLRAQLAECGLQDFVRQERGTRPGGISAAAGPRAATISGIAPSVAGGGD